MTMTTVLWNESRTCLEMFHRVCPVHTAIQCRAIDLRVPRPILYKNCCRMFLVHKNMIAYFNFDTHQFNANRRQTNNSPADDSFKIINLCRYLPSPTEFFTQKIHRHSPMWRSMTNSCSLGNWGETEVRCETKIKDCSMTTFTSQFSDEYILRYNHVVNA